MALKLKNAKMVSNYIKTYSKRIERVLLLELEYLVAELENHAKSNAGYKDQTSNLKGSIGGVLLKDGRILNKVGFDEFGREGNTTGLEFINSLISEFPRGYVIILVAGMEYATYVENFHDLNVLKKSELKMRRDLPKLLNGLKNKIDKLN